MLDSFVNRFAKYLPGSVVIFLEEPFYFWGQFKYRITPLLGLLVLKLVGKANVLKVISELFRIVAGHPEHPVKLLVLVADSESKIKLLDLAHGRFLASDHLHQITIKGSEWFPLNYSRLQSASSVSVLDVKRYRLFRNYISKIICKESSFPHPV